MCDIFTIGICVTHCKAGHLEECYLCYSWKMSVVGCNVM